MSDIPGIPFSQIYFKMNEITYSTVTKIMDTIYAMPTNSDFMSSVADQLEGYREKIAKPMHLEAIQTKLRNKEYKTVHEWYDDVILVYNNALEYYTPENPYYQLAEYNKKQFKKLALGFDCQDTQSWYSKLRESFDELIKLAGQSPVPQGLDPWLSILPFHADNAIPLHPSEISETIDFLNRELQQSDEKEASNVRNDIYAILKEMEPNLQLSPEENMIDVKNLNEMTIRALNIYMKAHAPPNTENSQI